MPRPSTGCQKCRQRRVKCDEAKPSCLKCSKLGYTCPGYRDTCGVIIQDDTSRVYSRYQRRLRTEASSQFLFTLPGAIEDDPVASSVCFFFAEYVQGPSLLRRPYFNPLARMYRTATSASPLTLAVNFTAVRAARLHLGRRVSRTLAAECGSRALQALKAAIADPEDSVRDETLLAILCLDFAEHLASRSDGAAASRAHVEGALALIYHRGLHSFNNPVSAALLAGTESLALLSALWLGADKSIQDAVAALPDVDMTQHGQLAVLHQLFSRTLRLERQILDQNSTVMSGQPDSTTSKALLTIQRLCAQMDEWIQAVPSEWQSLLAQPHSPPSLVLTESNSDPHLVEMAYILAQWHCTKLTVLRLLYVALTTQEPPLPNMSSSSSGVLRTAQVTADGLCYMVTLLALAPSPSPTRVQRLERSLSGILPPATGESSGWKGGVLDGKHCCLNILRWAHHILVEEKDTVPNFRIDQNTVDYLEQSMQLVTSTFNR